MTAVGIIWFRQDLRLHDHPALAAAAANGRVVPVFILDDDSPGRWKMGAAQRWWLHHSLASLDQSLRDLGSRLILRRGRASEILKGLAAEVGASRIHAIEHYEPWWVDAERELAADHDLVLHPGDVLVPPAQVRTAANTAFKIYTPYWRALEPQLPPPGPLPTPSRLRSPERWPRSDPLSQWALLPSRPNWAAGFSERWQPGEAAALERLEHFAGEAWHYADHRDLPGEEGTSSLSPHLHFGEISPRRVWYGLPDGAGDKFRKELAWRDFSRNVVIAQPHLGDEPGRGEFAKFPWRSGPQAEQEFAAWTMGRTGYPLVDAGMRQLWATGWMHNRVRMIAASFLVKHLLIDWRRGFSWFWDTLVDADYGNNGQNWQWIAGSGVDSQPFNRIMAPILQSRKFGAADYIRRWVPELARLDADRIHDPGEARPSDYPAPIVAHGFARERALAAFRAFASTGQADRQ
ncbi:MAG: cryptochrome/photolyase family protein [Allosphingosinicella sp.]